MEWTVLENLLLAQAVYKHGEENWALIARDLRHHAMLNRQSDFFNQKNCSLQYYLLIEELETEKRQTKIFATPEMPSVVKLARKFYTQRIDELKDAIKIDEEKFMNIVSEIDDIRSGRWDKNLTQVLKEKEIVNGPEPANHVAAGDTSSSTVLPNISESMKSEEQESSTAAELATATDESVIGDITKEVEQQNIQRLLATSDDVRTPPGDHGKPSPDQQQAASKTVNETPSSSPRLDTSLKDTVPKDVTLDTITKTTSALDEPQNLLHSPAKTESSNYLETANSDATNRIVVTEPRTLASKRKLDEVENTFEGETDVASPKVRRLELDGKDQEPKTSLSLTAGIASSSESIPNDDRSELQEATLSIFEQDELSERSAGTPQRMLSPDLDKGEKSGDGENAGSVSGSESNVTSPTAVTTPSSPDRKRGREEQRQKSWQKNINLLWREIANHKNGAMFMNPIKEATAPLYYDIVKHPIDLKTIKNRIKDGIIKTTVEFERDVVLMLTNSLMYNKEGTEIYQMAQKMWEDAAEQMKIFKTADGNTSTSAHTRKSSTVAKERSKYGTEQ
ncbi:hypothetical protein DFQ29_006483 [Apophysomyces sp. BC1021]|nr:hypothetical protein DFQ29_006483 [Apophysomyces sp. BC1021]